MYYVLVNLIVNNSLVHSYSLYGSTSEKLFVNAISYFRGYVQAYTDCHGFEMFTPAVMSLDGFHAWSKTSVHKIELVNKHGVIISKSTDIY